MRSHMMLCLQVGYALGAAASNLIGFVIIGILNRIDPLPEGGVRVLRLKSVRI